MTIRLREQLVTTARRMSELGLTPAARVGLSSPRREEVDPFDAFLRGA